MTDPATTDRTAPGAVPAMNDSTPRAAEQAGDVYVDALMEARPDAALARALPSAVGRHRVEAARRVAEIVRDYVPFEDTHRYPAMTDLRTLLPDIEALASGAQAGAAGDRPGAAPAHRVATPGGLNKAVQAVQRIKDRCDDRAGHLCILDECDKALGVLTDLAALGAAPAGGLPGVEAIAKPGEWLFGVRDILAAFHRSASHPNARMHEIGDAVLKLAALGCPPGAHVSAAGTGDAGRPSPADKIMAGLDDVAAGRFDVVRVAAPPASLLIAARVADDLAYCSEIDAALADRHGSSVVGAAARPIAADGLRSEAIFLLERLKELGDDAFTEDGHRDFHGHVVPSMSRLLKIVTAFDAAPSADRGEAGDALPTWRHVKTGGIYEEVGRAYTQNSFPMLDHCPVVVYRSVKDGGLWVRPGIEFHDGRFEPTPRQDQTP